MELIGDMGPMESYFGPFGDSASVGARFAPNTNAQKSFWTHPMVLLGDKAQVEAQFSPFRDSANLDER
jgi:hypothetical protein